MLNNQHQKVISTKVLLDQQPKRLSRTESRTDNRKRKQKVLFDQKTTKVKQNRQRKRKTLTKTSGSRSKLNFFVKETRASTKISLFRASSRWPGRRQSSSRRSSRIQGESELPQFISGRATLIHTVAGLPFNRNHTLFITSFTLLELSYF